MVAGIRRTILNGVSKTLSCPFPALALRLSPVLKSGKKEEQEGEICAELAPPIGNIQLAHFYARFKPKVTPGFMDWNTCFHLQNQLGVRYAQSYDYFLYSAHLPFAIRVRFIFHPISSPNLLPIRSQGTKNPKVIKF